MKSLWLVRHVMPAHGPAVPAAAWELSEQGRQDAESICSLFPSGALLVSSTEPKARQTLEPAGDVRTDERFNVHVLGCQNLPAPEVSDLSRPWWDRPPRVAEST
jgi:broad specificity phosphatase PhoE